MALYEVFTYGNGELMSDILNAVASVVNDDGDGYKSFIGLGVMVAFASLVLTSAFNLKLEKVIKWYAMVMCVYSALIIPKADVLITDPVMRNAQYEVSGVPIGLAFLISSLTRIEYGLTTALET